MSDRTDQTNHQESSSGPEVEVTPATANTDPAVTDVNPEGHHSATDDLSDPNERPQVDEDIARGRGREAGS
ncbi:MAG TPA: hypothetical protein VGT61_02035 [Thermomicrobiales bacterium]|jgi:hypothetical protein|nr:hypothetical protein [Thermomicrobiales bacterium]